MAHRMNITQFGRHYPQEAAKRYYESSSMMQQGRNNFSHHYGQQQEQLRLDSSDWKQPPSWADVPAFGANNVPRYPEPATFQFQPAEPWTEESLKPSVESNDVFSSMSHWGPPPNANKYQNNQTTFHQPPPMPSANQTPAEDVFSNIGEWNGNTVPMKSPMTIDVNATAPLSTFPAYENRRTHSLESPTTSMTSTEEKNSWKSIEAILNSKPSRSPSVADECDIFFPVDSNGFWNSNLQNY